MTATTEERTTADLLLEWDRRRPRSLQIEFGMSGLGDCRRRAGYQLAGMKPTNIGSSVQAVMGTAIHEAATQILRDMRDKGLVPADALIEHEVTFAGILGHLDMFVEPDLTDIKTTSARWLAKLKVNGPTRSHLWQAHGYAAALIAQGRKVRRIIIDYLARDTGEQWRWIGRFDPRHVRDALEWLAVVRQTELDFLPRDHDPNGPFCEHCPFFDACWDGYVTERDLRSVLYVEDPDAAGWVGKLEDARDRMKQAKADEAVAKGALDALRPNEDDSATVRVPGVDVALRWSVSRPKRIDAEQIRRDYAAAGRPVPEKEQARPTVRLDLVDPEDGA